MTIILNAPTGRSSTYVIAAIDATAHVMAQADYVCDGIADDVEIQAAIDALPAGGGNILLSEGTFALNNTVAIGNKAVRLSGYGATLVSTITPIQVTGYHLLTNQGTLMPQSRLIIEGLHLKRATAGTGIGLYIVKTYGAILRDLIITNFDWGIAYEQSTSVDNENTIFENIWIDNPIQGFRLAGAAGFEAMSYNKIKNLRIRLVRANSIGFYLAPNTYLIDSPVDAVVWISGGASPGVAAFRLDGNIYRSYTDWVIDAFLDAGETGTGILVDAASTQAFVARYRAFQSGNGTLTAINDSGNKLIARIDLESKWWEPPIQMP